MATMACYPTFEPNQQTSTINTRSTSINTSTTTQQKDYSKPLHVDCSVEYELPNQARPPGKSEPLLMIHPCFYRRAESQRRSPFINNLPQPVQQPQTTVQRRTSTRSTTSNANNNLLLQQQRYAVQQQQQQQQQQQLRYMEQVQQQAYQQQNIVATTAACWTMDTAAASAATIYCKPPTTRTTRRNSRKTQIANKEMVLTNNNNNNSNNNNRGHVDYNSSGDSGISGVLWTDTERSPANNVHGLCVVDNVNLSTQLDKTLLNESSQQQSQAPQPPTTTSSTTQQQTTTSRRTYSLRSTDTAVTNTTTTGGDLAELLAVACGAEHLPPLPKVGVAPGKTQIPSQPQQSTTQHMCHQTRCSNQQPAVGVAAVATSCRTCRQLPTQYQIPQLPTVNQTQQQQPQQQQQQQPWPAQFAHPPAAVPATACEPGPEPASSTASGQVRRSWSTRSSQSAKRSRTSIPSTSTTSWATNPFIDNAWQQQQQQQRTTACGLGSNNNNNNTKDCGAMCKVCCPTSQPQQQQTAVFSQEQQWNSSYYCRNEDAGGRMMWNNENMLRLFQV